MSIFLQTPLGSSPELPATRHAPTGSAPSLPFSREEYRQRVRAIRREMQAQGLEVLMLTSPENIYYISGYHTTGYHRYQAMLLPLSGTPLFVVRALEIGHVWGLSWIKKAVALDDGDDPLEGTVEALSMCGARSARIGFEDQRFFLPPAILDGLRARLRAARFVPASGIIERCRVIKTAAEIDYIRVASRAAVAAMRAAVARIQAGRSENDVAAAVYRGLLKAGSEYPSIPPHVGAGERSALGHASYEGHTIRRGDTVYVEVAASRRRYGGAVMRTVAVGAPSLRTRKTAGVVVSALDALIEAIRPGVTADAVDRAGRTVVEGAGLGRSWLHRSGYSIGISFPPGLGEGYAFDLKPRDQRRLAPGMTFHLVPVLLIPGLGAMGFSETVLVTDSGCELLSQFPRRLFVR